MEIIKNYRHDAALRRSFNALAEQAFGLNFENWYNLGYWGDDYCPYSVVEDFGPRKLRIPTLSHA